jgi:hypothetical protein
MNKDKKETQETQNQFQIDEDNRLKTMLDGERENTKILLEQENRDLSTILNQDQNRFENIISTLLKTHKEDVKKFSGVLNKEQKLYEREEELAESYSGKLYPGSSSDPFPNGCEGEAPASATFIIFGGENGSWTTTFPHTVLMVNGRPELQLIKLPSGVIAPVMDIRDAEGKIIARFDANGFVIGRRLSISRPDASTLIVIDEYGNQALLINYLNPKAILITGYMYVRGRRLSININPYDSPFHSSVRHSCSGGNVLADIAVDF